MSPTRSESAPRIHILMARKAPVAVLLRRGPSRWVQMVRWDTSNDTFERGQWFRGRIYEDYCELSPSGELIACVAMKLGNKPLERRGIDQWVAVSRPPYFSALALFPLGGPLPGYPAHFIDDVSIQVPCVSAWYGTRMPELPIPPEWLRIEDGFGWELRRLADAAGGIIRGLFIPKPPQDARGVLIKSQPSPTFPLRLILRGQPQSPTASLHRPDSLTLEDQDGHEVWELKRVTSADWDQRGRLVYALDGKIFAAIIQNHRIAHTTELLDLTADKPETFAAPAWATSPERYPPR